MPLGAGNEQHLGLVPIITCVLNTGHQTADTPEFQMNSPISDRYWFLPSLQALEAAVDPESSQFFSCRLSSQKKANNSPTFDSKFNRWRHPLMERTYGLHLPPQSTARNWPGNRNPNASLSVNIFLFGNLFYFSTFWHVEIINVRRWLVGVAGNTRPESVESAE